MKKYFTIIGKTSGLDHIWPDHIDHHKPELSACCLVVYVNCNLTGGMWSICWAFALNARFEKNPKKASTFIDISVKLDKINDLYAIYGN